MLDRKDLRIVFMGTPAFGVPILEMLLDGGYHVVGVITQPDRPKGRGHRLAPPPVKELAEERHVAVFQPARISSPEGVEVLRQLEPDLLITAAFGQILSQEVLDLPKYGCINVHASLLPKYRGASPIVRAIMNGEGHTGITTMRTVRALDAGAIYEQDVLAIQPEDTGGSLTEKMARLGARTLDRTLQKLLAGGLEPREQDEDEATYYPMFPKGYGAIDWSRSRQDILNFIRALAPSPMAFFEVGGEKIRVASATDAGLQPPGTPGEIVQADARHGLLIRAADGLVSIEELRRPGARQMSAKESLRGRPLPLGALAPGPAKDKE